VCGLQKIMWQAASTSLPILLILSCLSQSQATEEDTEHKHDSQHDPEVLILFFCIGLLLGGFVSFALSRLRSKLPYTVVIFVIGVFLGILVSDSFSFTFSLTSSSTQADNFDLGHLGFAITDWRKLNPEMMLFLFLPVLVFGEAMSLKWFVLILSLTMHALFTFLIQHL
jgi:hypothetical protein